MTTVVFGLKYFRCMTIFLTLIHCLLYNKGSRSVYSVNPSPPLPSFQELRPGFSPHDYNRIQKAKIINIKNNTLGSYRQASETIH